MQHQFRDIGCRWWFSAPFGCSEGTAFYRRSRSLTAMHFMVSLLLLLLLLSYLLCTSWSGVRPPGTIAAPQSRNIQHCGWLWEPGLQPQPSPAQNRNSRARTWWTVRQLLSLLFSCSLREAVWIPSDSRPESSCVCVQFSSELSGQLAAGGTSWPQWGSLYTHCCS